MARRIELKHEQRDWRLRGTSGIDPDSFAKRVSAYKKGQIKTKDAAGKLLFDAGIYTPTGRLKRVYKS